MGGHLIILSLNFDLPYVHPRAGAESKTLGGQTYWEVEILGGAAGRAVLVGSQNIGGAAAPPCPPVPPALKIIIASRLRIF